MPFIRVVKPGKFPSLDGEDAFQMIEVDDAGNPVVKRSPVKYKGPVKKGGGRPNKGLTEAKIAPGVRAPDVEKGYKTPFDYHLWNKLRKQRGK